MTLQSFQAGLISIRSKFTEKELMDLLGFVKLKLTGEQGWISWRQFYTALEGII